MILKKKIFEWSATFKSIKYGDNFDGCCGIHPFELSDDDIQSLKDGKVLCNDGGEYAILIRRKKKMDKYLNADEQERIMIKNEMDDWPNENEAAMNNKERLIESIEEELMEAAIDSKEFGDDKLLYAYNRGRIFAHKFDLLVVERVLSEKERK